MHMLKRNALAGHACSQLKFGHLLCVFIKLTALFFCLQSICTRYLGLQEIGLNNAPFGCCLDAPLRRAFLSLSVPPISSFKAKRS
jgi:hypothetical protein